MWYGNDEKLSEIQIKCRLKITDKHWAIQYMNTRMVEIELDIANIARIGVVNKETATPPG